MYIRMVNSVNFACSTGVSCEIIYEQNKLLLHNKNFNRCTVRTKKILKLQISEGSQISQVTRLKHGTFNPVRL